MVVATTVAATKMIAVLLNSGTFGVGEAVAEVVDSFFSSRDSFSPIVVFVSAFDHNPL